MSLENIAHRLHLSILDHSHVVKFSVTIESDESLSSDICSPTQAVTKTIERAFEDIITILNSSEDGYSFCYKPGALKIPNGSNLKPQLDRDMTTGLIPFPDSSTIQEIINFSGKFTEIHVFVQPNIRSPAQSASIRNTLCRYDPILRINGEEGTKPKDVIVPIMPSSKSNSAPTASSLHAFLSLKPGSVFLDNIGILGVGRDDGRGPTMKLFMGEPGSGKSILLEAGKSFFDITGAFGRGCRKGNFKCAADEDQDDRKKTPPNSYLCLHLKFPQATNLRDRNTFKSNLLQQYLEESIIDFVSKCGFDDPYRPYRRTFEDVMGMLDQTLTKCYQARRKVMILCDDIDVVHRQHYMATLRPHSTDAVPPYDAPDVFNVWKTQLDKFFTRVSSWLKDRKVAEVICTARWPVAPGTLPKGVKWRRYPIVSERNHNSSVQLSGAFTDGHLYRILALAGELMVDTLDIMLPSWEDFLDKRARMGTFNPRFLARFFEATSFWALTAQEDDSPSVDPSFFRYSGYQVDELEWYADLITTLKIVPCQSGLTPGSNNTLKSPEEEQAIKSLTFYDLLVKSNTEDENTVIAILLAEGVLHWEGARSNGKRRVLAFSNVALEQLVNGFRAPFLDPNEELNFDLFSRCLEDQLWTLSQSNQRFSCERALQDWLLKHCLRRNEVHHRVSIADEVEILESVNEQWRFLDIVCIPRPPDFKGCVFVLELKLVSLLQLWRGEDARRATCNPNREEVLKIGKLVSGKKEEELLEMRYLSHWEDGRPVFWTIENLKSRGEAQLESYVQGVVNGHWPYSTNGIPPRKMCPLATDYRIASRVAVTERLRLKEVKGHPGR